MIVGVGTDLVASARIASSVSRFGDRFAKKILSPDEFIEYQRVGVPSAFLAKRFAAKEAVSKALGTGMRHGVSFALITVLHDSSGKPSVRLDGAAASVAESKGIKRWHLSVSDEKDHALAFVVAET